jgi:predicted nucleic acid-binding protein
MFVLDTDHFTLLEWGGGAVGQRLTVLSRNLKDFSRAPGLRVEDWTA